MILTSEANDEGCVQVYMTIVISLISVYGMFLSVASTSNILGVFESL